MRKVAGGDAETVVGDEDKRERTAGKLHLGEPYRCEILT